MGSPRAAERANARAVSRQNKPQVMVLNPYLPSMRKVDQAAKGRLRTAGTAVTTARNRTPRERPSPKTLTSAWSRAGRHPENNNPREMAADHKRAQPPKASRSKA